MKRKTIIIGLVIIVFITLLSILFIKHQQYQREVNAQKRYNEIKNAIDKELQRYMYVIAPKCQKNSGTPLITHNQLVYNAGMEKDVFLDVDKKSYCGVYVETECVEVGKWEWNIYLSCKNYTDKGYKAWDTPFSFNK